MQSVAGGMDGSSGEDSSCEVAAAGMELGGGKGCWLLDVLGGRGGSCCGVSAGVMVSVEC